MNFSNFYNNAEQRIIDTMLSLWATGDANMQQYIKAVLEQEKVLAKPVFQNMFSWEPSENVFGQLNDLFGHNFIQRLNQVDNPEYKFPVDRKPYLHQEKSWRASTEQNKSILVTTGTGSGKTECFMLPVLHDIYTNNPNTEGVNAIFLYPLNALIGSQKKRMHEWCKALGNIKYGIYTGSTPESTSQKKQSDANPEVISRQSIRSNPPQILFTNPTMLEYMLVRDKDTALLNNSSGKLRWILLDEAHTLTGSKASEMALLIRRVVEAFNVDIQNVRFAVTSATVGDGNQKQLKQFMADLCGISFDNIVLITGNRILPSVNEQVFLDSNINPQIASNFRNEIYNKPCLTVQDVSAITGLINESDQLKFVDQLAEISENGKPVMPVRGHFFARNINGLYACTNPNCNEHPHIPNNIVGTITSISKKHCGCGYPLLELISCRTCGTFMMEGEVKNGLVKQRSKANSDFFEVQDNSEAEDDLTDGLDEMANNLMNSESYIIAKRLISKPFINNDILPIQVLEDSTIDHNVDEPFFHVEDGCPYCGDSLEKPFHFRLSAAFLNRLISDIVLEQTNDSNSINQQMLWKGKKYISFTDSRQGTAKISALINTDSENMYLKTQVFHNLCKKYNEGIVVLSAEERTQKQNRLNVLITELSASTPENSATLINEMASISNQLNNATNPISDSRISWSNMKAIILNNVDAQILFNKNIGGNLNVQGQDYINSLLYNEFARRLPRVRSLENLGMVNLVYPDLDNLVVPYEATILNIEQVEWKNLVKIALDYIIRYKFYYSIPETVRGMASSWHNSIRIYPSNTTVPNVAKWPRFDRNRIRPNRLTLLICAGLGLHETGMIDRIREDEINDLLDKLWQTLRQHFLTIDGNDGGYKLDFEQKASFELAGKIWLCPVKKRLIDTTFKGYSPWISGKLESDNIQSYFVENSLQFPKFPYPFNIDANNNINPQISVDWMNSNAEIDILKQNGLWNSLHERILNIKPLYLAGEHSAQQKKTRLLQLEDDFQNGLINILSCSTTMEMGVDIGGISAVVMSNVPPGPANYMQRTGRAGRRSENKSLAFTICPSNPIGSHVIDSPEWALTHAISSPVLSFSSKTVVERHLNALLLGKFIRQVLQGINVKERINGFFLPSPNLQDTCANLFLTFLINDIDVDLYNFIRNILIGTPLSDLNNAAIINKVYSNFDQIKYQVEQKIQNFNTALENILATDGYTLDSPAYKAIKYQQNQFLNKNLLVYLTEEGFLPAGGIPTGVVDFDNSNISDIRNANNEDENQLPSYHITRALTEYAPGMEVVIDGWVHTSAGLILQNNFGGQTTKSILQHCNNCGFEHILNNGQKATSECPECNQQTLRGINTSAWFTEIIEPVGFAVDLFGDKKRVISESSNAQYVEPLLINAEPWSDETHPIVEYRDSLPNAEIVYYNYGADNNGFSVCLECGRADIDRSALDRHKRLRGGMNQQNTTFCGGNENPFAIRENVMLVGRFQTDFFEIRCRDEKGELFNDESILYSLGQVLSKSLCTYLAIEEQEVDFGIKKYRGFKTIFLFDTAKGGAGYVSQFACNFEEVCRIALRIVSSCNCTSACTKCLIDRKSQHRIDILDRHQPKAWLERILDNTLPAEIINLLPNNPKKVIGSVKTELSRLLNKKQIQTISIFVDHINIEEWDIESCLLLNQLKNNGVALQVVFRGQPGALNIEQTLTLFQFKAALGNAFNFYYTNFYELGNLQQIARIELVNTDKYEYFAENFETSLNSQWGDAHNQFIYRQDTIDEIDLNSFEINFTQFAHNLVEARIQIDSQSILSNQIFDKLLNSLNQATKDRLANLLSSKSVSISYSERYLKSSYSCLIFVQFINSFIDHYSIELEKITLTLPSVREEKHQRTIIDNFEYAADRNTFIKDLVNDCGIEHISINVAPAPHERQLLIFIDGIKVLTIRPDVGIAGNWFPLDRSLPFDALRGRTVIEVKPENNNPGILYYLIFN